MVSQDNTACLSGSSRNWAQNNYNMTFDISVCSFKSTAYACFKKVLARKGLTKFIQSKTGHNSVKVQFKVIRLGIQGHLLSLKVCEVSKQRHTYNLVSEKRPCMQSFNKKFVSPNKRAQLDQHLIQRHGTQHTGSSNMPEEACGVSKQQHKCVSEKVI